MTTDEKLERDLKGDFAAGERTSPIELADVIPGDFATGNEEPHSGEIPGDFATGNEEPRAGQEPGTFADSDHR